MNRNKLRANRSPFRPTRRQALQGLGALGLGAASLSLARRRAGAAAPLVVFAWEGYEFPEVHPAFVEKYGDSPGFTLYNGVEEAFAKLRAGYRPDVGIAGLESLIDWREAGYMAPLDLSQIPNAGSLFHKLRTTKGAVGEDGTQWALPYVWGTASVIYRTDLAPEYVGRNTWEILWDPKYEGKISNVNAGTQVVVPAALLLGISDPFNMNDDELARVRAKVAEQRPLIRTYWDDFTSLQQTLASGEVVAAYGYSDSYLALKDEGVPVAYMNPDEGMLSWIDFLVLMTGGTAPLEMRYDYIDAALAPESGLFFIEDYGWGSANREAYALADPEAISAQGYDDPEQFLQTTVVLSPMPPATTEKSAIMFDEVKAGF